MRSGRARLGLRPCAPACMDRLGARRRRRRRPLLRLHGDRGMASSPPHL